VVYVYGIDHRTGAAVLVRHRDAASADPTLGVAERPSNWLGHPVQYAVADPIIGDQQAAVRACRALVDALTVRRKLVEFDAAPPSADADIDDLLLVGDVATVGSEDVRIKGMDVELITEDSVGHRVARVLGEVLAAAEDAPPSGYVSWRSDDVPLGFVV
jgi:hypothetical protein